LDVQLSNFLPWTPGLVAWFNAHFTLASSQTHAFVYKNNEAPVTNSNAPPLLNASQLVAAGLAAGRAGDVQKASDDYALAARKDPNNKFAQYNLGTIYQQRGDTTRAATQYLAALRIDPKFSDALYNMGVLEAGIDPTTAISYYTRDLRVDPTNASANFNLGVLLIEHGRPTEGYTYLQTGLRLNPALSAHIPAGISPAPATTTTS
jgi:tetratricopeptide (TPR) repeat protein